MSKTPLVCLDPGHNKKSVNRSPDGSYYEWEFAQDVCDKAAAIIKGIPGLECIKTKEADTYPTSLENRVKVAHDAGADLFLSQHSNAYGDGKTWTSPNGFGVYRYPGRNLKLAQIGLKWCQELLPMSNRGIKEADFYVIRETKMPSILFETGFHTNKEDVKKLKSQDFRVLAAQVLVYTAAEFLQVPISEEEETVMSAKYHRVVKGDTMSRIASDNKLSLTKLMEYNPHIENADKIYAEDPGDIVYLERPNEFEIKYAKLTRDLILVKSQRGSEELEAEIKELKARLVEEQARAAEAMSRVNEYKSIGRQINSLSNKLIN